MDLLFVLEIPEEGSIKLKVSNSWKFFDYLPKFCLKGASFKQIKILFYNLENKYKFTISFLKVIRLILKELRLLFRNFLRLNWPFIFFICFLWIAFKNVFILNWIATYYISVCSVLCGSISVISYICILDIFIAIVLSQNFLYKLFILSQIAVLKSLRRNLSIFTLLICIFIFFLSFFHYITIIINLSIRIRIREILIISKDRSSPSSCFTI